MYPLKKIIVNHAWLAGLLYSEGKSRKAVFYFEFWGDLKNGLKENSGRSFKRSKH